MATGMSGKSDIDKEGGGVNHRPCTSSVRIIESALSGAASVGQRQQSWSSNRGCRALHQPVQSRRILPQDIPLGRLRQARPLSDLLHRSREHGIPMWII